MNKDERLNKTFVQGVGGGILGAFIGLPGVGMVVGVAHANKDKIKKGIKKLDEMI